MSEELLKIHTIIWSEDLPEDQKKLVLDYNDERRAQYKAVYNDPIYPEELEARDRQPPNIYIIATIEDYIVGGAELRRKPPNGADLNFEEATRASELMPHLNLDGKDCQYTLAEIKGVIRSPAYKGQGILDKMQKAMIEAAREHGVDIIVDLSTAAGITSLHALSRYVKVAWLQDHSLILDKTEGKLNFFVAAVNPAVRLVTPGKKATIFLPEGEDAKVYPYVPGNIPNPLLKESVTPLDPENISPDLIKIFVDVLLKEELEGKDYTIEVKPYHIKITADNKRFDLTFFDSHYMEPFCALMEMCKDSPLACKIINAGNKTIAGKKFDYVVEEILENKFLSAFPSLEEIEQLGKAFAYLHSYHRSDSYLHNSGRRFDWRTLSKGNAAVLEADYLRQTQDDIIFPWLSKIKEFRERVPQTSEYGLTYDLSLQFNEAEISINQNNKIFFDGLLNGIYFGWNIKNVAECLAFYCVNEDGSLSEEKARSFLDAYQQTRPLTLKEKEILPSYIQAKLYFWEEAGKKFFGDNYKDRLGALSNRFTVLSEQMQNFNFVDFLDNNVPQAKLEKGWAKKVMQNDLKGRHFLENGK